MKKKIEMAICYDFDGTLSPKNMQEVSFIPKLQMTSEAFWKKAYGFGVRHQMDPILAYMKVMLDEARHKQIAIHRKDFQEHGRQIPLFKGVDTWFTRINGYADEKGVQLKHYLISSGLKEMVEGSSITDAFSAIFASSFLYDANDVAEWPAVAINYTTKTQYLFRINKGCFDLADNRKINQYVEPQDRPLPFSQMIYIGDGETDIPCMRLLKDAGGHSVAVYRPHTKGAKEKASSLINDGRVNALLCADYREGSALDTFIKNVIEKVVADKRLEESQGIF